MLQFKGQVHDIWYQSSFGPRDLSERVMADSNQQRTLIVTVYNARHPITENVLHQVFDPYGKIEMIHILPEREHFKALLRFQYHNSVKSAKACLHGRNIYDGCCRLDLQFLATSFWDCELSKEDTVESTPSDIYELMKEMSSTIDKLISQLDNFRKSAAEKEVSQSELQVFDEKPVKEFKEMEADRTTFQVYDKMIISKVIPVNLQVFDNMVVKEEDTKNSLGNPIDDVLGEKLGIESTMKVTSMCLSRRGEKYSAVKEDENRNAEDRKLVTVGKPFSDYISIKFHFCILFDPGGCVVNTWVMSPSLNLESAIVGVSDLSLNFFGKFVVSWMHMNYFLKFSESSNRIDAFWGSQDEDCKWKGVWCINSTSHVTILELSDLRGHGNKDKMPLTDRSLTEIFSNTQRSRLGFLDWSLSDLTIDLYLMYLQQASTGAAMDVKGDIFSLESIVQDPIYHIEREKGAYRTAVQTKNNMLREKNVVKFVKSSSELRLGYYLGIDMWKKLVIIGIRGTHIAGHGEMTLEGYSTHFVKDEVVRWFLYHEIDTIRKCLKKHKSFIVRLVGHSVGCETAYMLVTMLRKMSFREIGFSPELTMVVAYATPARVSKEFAESCYDYVTMVVMVDHINPRLSVASLTRLRKEIFEMNWDNIFNREDWKGVLDLVSNVKQVVSSVQDMARKLAECVKFKGQIKNSEMHMKKEVLVVTGFSPTPSNLVKPDSTIVEALSVRSTLSYLKKNEDVESHHKAIEYYTLLKTQAGENFQRKMLSSNLNFDHSDGSQMVRGVCYYHRDFFENLDPRGRGLVDQGGNVMTGSHCAMVLLMWVTHGYDLTVEYVLFGFNSCDALYFYSVLLIVLFAVLPNEGKALICLVIVWEREE